jgi:DNA-binding LacI/PurR family transcriptional regulator
MRQDLTRHGQEAARLLIRRIENPGCPPEHLQLPAQLILRQSVLPYERR